MAAIANDEKEHIYALKNKALHYLLAEGRIHISGYHCFPDDNWAGVLQGDGYIFHRPCPPQLSANGKQINNIESKPRCSKEPRLKDAYYTIETYLAYKSDVPVFQWPTRKPVKRTREPFRKTRRWFDDYDDLADEADEADEFSISCEAERTSS